MYSEKLYNCCQYYLKTISQIVRTSPSPLNPENVLSPPLIQKCQKMFSPHLQWGDDAMGTLLNYDMRAKYKHAYSEIKD